MSGCHRKCIVVGNINNGLIVTVKELNQVKQGASSTSLDFIVTLTIFWLLSWIGYILYILHLHDIALIEKWLWQSSMTATST